MGNRVVTRLFHGTNSTTLDARCCMFCPEPRKIDDSAGHKGQRPQSDDYFRLSVRDSRGLNPGVSRFAQLTGLRHHSHSQERDPNSNPVATRVATLRLRHDSWQPSDYASDLRFYWWAMRDSNPRPLPCKVTQRCAHEFAEVRFSHVKGLRRLRRTLVNTGHFERVATRALQEDPQTRKSGSGKRLVQTYMRRRG